MNNCAIGQDAAGFTLIELMVTLLVASILMGVVAPGMATLVERNRLQTTSESLYTSLMLARSEALKRNREVLVCKSSDGASCATGVDTQWEQGWLVYVDVDGDGAVDADEILRVSGPLAEGMTLRVAGDFDDEIGYGTDGTASGTGAFVMCNPTADTQSAREIAVSFTGRPKMNKTTASCVPA
jgi:type IV fimbrial biogenesis protein FimT